MAKHLELSVEINPVWAEYVADILINSIGASGVVTEEIEYEDEKIIKSITNFVKGYIWLDEKNPPDLEKIQNILLLDRKKLLNTGISSDNLGNWTLSSKEIDEEDWAHSWKKYWHPQKIGSKIVICPSWEEYKPNNEEILIHLDPGSAFGTGTHPTTKLCIVALEKYMRSNYSMADIGTGSGILAIAGAKFGAKSIIGVDNDPSVIQVAKENADINDVGNKCTFYEGSAVDIKENFDIVTANILAHVLISMMKELYSITKIDGKIILSGIIAEKAEEVKNSALETGFNFLETFAENNWVAIVLQKISNQI